MSGRSLKIAFIVLGSVLAITSTVVSDLELSRIETQRAETTSSYEEIRNEELSHQYSLERSYHDLSTAETLMSILEATHEFEASRIVRVRVADSMYLAVLEMADACGCVVNHQALDKSHQALVNGVNNDYTYEASLVRQLQGSYGDYIHTSNAKRKQVEGQADSLSASESRIRVWATLFQVLGIIIVLIKDVVGNND